MEEPTAFRGAGLGGFNKKDVSAYIFAQNERHIHETALLNEEKEKLQKDLDISSKRNAEDASRIQELLNQHASLEDELKSENEKSACLTLQVEALEQRCNILSGENEKLRMELADVSARLAAQSDVAICYREEGNSIVDALLKRYHDGIGPVMERLTSADMELRSLATELRELTDKMERK